VSSWLQRLAEEEPDAAAAASLAEPPEDAFVPLGAETWWKAWCELREERWYGALGGCGRLKWTAIDQFARRYDIHGSDFESMCEVLRTLDGVFMKWAEEQAKRRAAQQKN